MWHKKWIFISLLSALLWAENNETNSSKEHNTPTESNITNPNKISPKIDSDMSQFNGAWHLRVMDGMEVRKARAILDFTFSDKKTELSGFDGCNRITGAIKQTNDTNISVPFIMSTRMACRENIHNWVSTRLHKTLNEGFYMKEEEKYGLKGITLKSSSHELFFKKMERE